MKNYVREILQIIAKENPVHFKKIKKNIDRFPKEYFPIAESFFKKYDDFLISEGKSFEYGVKCYLSMIADMNIETVDFMRTGKYSSNTFEEVNQRVYSNPEVMEYYMHGLALSQFLWEHHYKLFSKFTKKLTDYKDKTKSYLEIGAGHGLYLAQAVDAFHDSVSFDVVDISATSINIAQKFNESDKVNFQVKNIFDYDANTSFDFITMGEVLEHVEDPKTLLKKLYDLLSPGGTAFITTPTNAPAIDHIYLFNDIDEIKTLINETNFKIVEDMTFYSEDVSPERAKKIKISVLYGAFITKK
jgi:2-polyprenyl-3-methyl-5-hydroxy-6-metoxy-1,4-benzoquinol methylase